MQIPNISHLQFAVLTIIRSNTKTGEGVRATLKKLGQSHSDPAFYQLMGRMALDGYIVAEMCAGYHGKSNYYRYRTYSITSKGCEVWSEVRDFYHYLFELEETDT